MGKYAILIVSILIFSMITYSHALRNALFISNTRTVESYSQNQAHNIAQSALMVAVNNLRSDDNSVIKTLVENLEEEIPDYYPSINSFENWPELKGSYNFQFQINNNNILEIISTGRFEETEYSVRLGLTIDEFGIWSGANIDQAVHAENLIDLGNGEIDGDASVNNAYNSLSMNPNANITGNFLYYDQNESDEDGGHESSAIGGQIMKMEDPLEFEDPIFPGFPTGNMPLQEPAGGQTLNPIDYENFVFESFNANNNTIYVGDTDRTLHVKDLDLSGDINIDGSAELSIYVENSLNLGNGDINASGLTENLTIYYKGESDVNMSGNGTFKGTLFSKHNNAGISVGGNSTFTGHIFTFGNSVTLNGTPTAAALIYAPNASVTLSGTGRPGSRVFEGAIVADTFTINGRPIVRYNPDFASTLPELIQDGDANYDIAFWN